MKELDRLDLRILHVLQEDGRIPILQLAEKVGLSATPCARRVKQLESEGFIERYVTLLNSAKFEVGLDVFVSVRLRSQTSGDCEKFERHISGLQQVVGCYLLAGAFDYLLHVKIADVSTYGEFMRSRINSMDVVVETQSSVVIQRLKHTTAIPLPPG